MPPEPRNDPSMSIQAHIAHMMMRERERVAAKQSEIAKVVGVSVQLYGHYENCRRIPGLDVLEKLDAFYGYEDIQLFASQYPHLLRELELTAEVLEFFKQESLASGIKIYQPLFLPGLLQTPEYARAVLETIIRSGERLEQSISERLDRQEILARREPDPPELTVVLKESVLREIVGSPEIMRKQLEHLLGLMARPGIFIHVVPAGKTMYVSGEIVLLEYPEGGTLAYAEAAGGHGGLIQVPAQVYGLRVLFDRLRSQALPVEETERLIREVMESL